MAGVDQWALTVYGYGALAARPDVALLDFEMPGLDGLAAKDAPADSLADAIRRVAAGERVVDPALAVATLAAGESPLTATRNRMEAVRVADRNGWL